MEKSVTVESVRGCVLGNPSVSCGVEFAVSCSSVGTTVPCHRVWVRRVEAGFQRKTMGMRTAYLPIAELQIYAGFEGFRASAATKPVEVRKGSEFIET